jgi:hypothetical protein
MESTSKHSIYPSSSAARHLRSGGLPQHTTSQAAPTQRSAICRGRKCERPQAYNSGPDGHANHQRAVGFGQVTWSVFAFRKELHLCRKLSPLFLGLSRYYLHSGSGRVGNATAFRNECLPSFAVRSRKGLVCEHMAVDTFQSLGSLRIEPFQFPRLLFRMWLMLDSGVLHALYRT